MHGSCLWLPLLAANILLAHSVNDLNSLVLQADRFAATEMANQGDPEALELFLIHGTSALQEGGAMGKGVEVQTWVLTYRILSPERTAPHHGGVRQYSLRVTCQGGVFKGIAWLSVPVMDYKPLEWIWITIPLEDAIQKLNDAGFHKGFTRVTLMRSLFPKYPDTCTYVFRCPGDSATVGISAQTGELLWTETWPK
jgi:hypothetical protein